MHKTLCTFAALFLLASLSYAQPARRTPNILFILVDDRGWTALHSYGNKDVATPNLNRLAAQGVRFTQAYADAQCSPTGASFFSGRYGARTGVFKVIHEKEPPFAFMRPPDANLALQLNDATLAQTLRAVGYATGMSGKWHIADNYSAAPLRARNGGKYFDRYGFDFVGPANENAHKEDKATAAITDDILGFIEAGVVCVCRLFRAAHANECAARVGGQICSARFQTHDQPVAKAAERPTAE